MFYKLVFYFLMYLSKHVGPKMVKKVVVLGLKSQIFSPVKGINARMKTKLLGRELKTPVGLSSDFDRRGGIFDLLTPLGISFGEMGSYTLLADSVSEKKYFLPQYKAIHTKCSAVNNPGITRGAQIMASRRHLKGLIGASIISFGSEGDNFSAGAGAIYGYGNDYHQMAMKIAPYVDYVSVNLSHPNMTLAQMLSDETTLLPMLLDIKGAFYLAAPLAPPKMVVKVPYDLSDLEVKLIASTCQKASVDAIIVSGPADAGRQMRSIFRRGDRADFTDNSFITGAPLKKDVLQLVKRFYLETGGKMDIVASGGIFTPKDAYDAIEHGASAVQINTVLLYKGPDAVIKIVKGLNALLEKNKQTVASLRGRLCDLDSFVKTETKRETVNNDWDFFRD